MISLGKRQLRALTARVEPKVAGEFWNGLAGGGSRIRTLGPSRAGIDRLEADILRLELVSAMDSPLEGKGFDLSPPLGRFGPRRRSRPTTTREPGLGS